MKHFATLSLAVILAACGGGESADNNQAATSQPAAQQPAAASSAEPSGEMTKPEWYKQDDAAKTVHLTITAGETDALNHWNFNGHYNGNMAITVPEGYAVTIEFHNADPAMAHSLGIEHYTGTFPANMQPDPVFEGAITSNPTSMTEATLPGKEETIHFTASKAGKYAMTCTIAGHAAVGMWIHFNVSSDGSAGVQGA